MQLYLNEGQQDPSASSLTGIYITHSPPVTALVPKLLPTVPVQVQRWLSALVHCAVAVADGWRHVIEARPGAAASKKSARPDEYIITRKDEMKGHYCTVGFELLSVKTRRTGNALISSCINNRIYTKSSRHWKNLLAFGQPRWNLCFTPRLNPNPCIADFPGGNDTIFYFQHAMFANCPIITLFITRIDILRFFHLRG